MDTPHGLAKLPQPVRAEDEAVGVIRAEIRQLRRWGDRHRLLIARISIVAFLTSIVLVIGSVLTWMFERNAPNTDIHTYGDALFFTAVQLLTVSSQIRNPFTVGGRIVDVFLEIWAVFVVTAVAGSFASFLAPEHSEKPKGDST